MAKEVTDREAAAEAVAAAAEAHAEQIEARFNEKFKAFTPKKQALPNMGVAMRALAAAVRASAHDLVTRSAAHDAELADDAGPREARDRSTAELVQTMVGIRATVESVYGRAGLKALGIDGRTPTDSKAVLEHARKLASQLGDSKLKLPAPQDGVAVDRKVWAARIEASIPTLTQARKDVAREEREAEITSNAKAKSLEAFDEMFGVVAAFTSSMLDLIGEDDLASRIKPSVRRRGVTAESDATDGAAPAEPPKG